jgi:hypothetical protein
MRRHAVIESDDFERFIASGEAAVDLERGCGMAVGADLGDAEGGAP